MQVKKLSTPEDLERYIDFAREVYRNNQIKSRKTDNRQAAEDAELRRED
jgi:hypothetical protein